MIEIHVYLAGVYNQHFEWCVAFTYKRNDTKV